MGTVNIPDFEKVGIGQALLDVGEYTCTIHKAPKEEFADDKPYLEIPLRVAQGREQKEPDQNGSKDPTGREFHDRVYLTPTALWRLKRLLVSAGLLARDDKTSDMAKGNINLDALVGCTVRIKMTPNIREGREYRNVEYVV